VSGEVTDLAVSAPSEELNTLKTPIGPSVETPPPVQLEDTSAAKPLPLEEAQALLGPVGQDKSPQTKIQIRLASGRKLVLQVNLNHTLADIHRVVRACEPCGIKGFRLVNRSTLAKPTLPDDTQTTVLQAGLTNGVVQQDVL